MTFEACQTNQRTPLFSNTLRRIWGLTKRTASRYSQWQKMKQNHRLLITMDDRMLKDIGLSRADAIRVSNAHTFWKFMFQPESNDRHDRAGQSN